MITAGWSGRMRIERTRVSKCSIISGVLEDDVRAHLDALLAVDLRCIVSVKLDDDKVSDIWEMVRVAEAKVGRICASHGAIGELRGWMREDLVPPLEEFGWVALR